MNRRGRPRKNEGQSLKINAAIDAIFPMGFPKTFIRHKVCALLKLYGGKWNLIEENGYKVLLDTILAEMGDGNATCVPQAGEKLKWKSISWLNHHCPQDMVIAKTDIKDGSSKLTTELEENGLQELVGLSLPRRRKPCFGWISNDNDNNGDCTLFGSEMSRKRKMRLSS